MLVLRRIAVLLITLIIAGSWIMPGQLYAADGSFVIGRITGTRQELPGYFSNSPIMHEQGIDNVEFPGFRLVRRDDGKRFLIRPNRNGFFYQGLTGGEYTLTRKRNDRPSYKEPKTIDILSFEVEPGTLVNLGTVHLILDGEPLESLSAFRNPPVGVYTYRYRYEREPGDHGFDDPFNWFTKKKPDTSAGFENRVVLENAAPTGEVDGSKVTLRELKRRLDD